MHYEQAIRHDPTHCNGPKREPWDNSLIAKDDTPLAIPHTAPINNKSLYLIRVWNNIPGQAAGKRTSYHSIRGTRIGFSPLEHGYQTGLAKLSIQNVPQQGCMEEQRGWTAHESLFKTPPPTFRRPTVP